VPKIDKDVFKIVHDDGQRSIAFLSVGVWCPCSSASRPNARRSHRPVQFRIMPAAARNRGDGPVEHQADDLSSGFHQAAARTAGTMSSVATNPVGAA